MVYAYAFIRTSVSAYVTEAGERQQEGCYHAKAWNTPGDILLDSTVVVGGEYVDGMIRSRVDNQ